MAAEHNHQRLNELFNYLADEIEVPPSKYREAQDRYNAVGAWLGEDDSELSDFDPTIYPQGSFALGTAVRPLGEDQYDVDSVCLLEIARHQITQKALKELVGARLKHPKSRYKDMIKPKQGGRRCWTIQYADASKFHLDVLPAIPDDFGWLLTLGVPLEWAKSAICITDRKTWDTKPNEWPRSNPKGYSAWFKERMRIRLEEAKHAMAVELRAEVEDIEDFEVRTPLQRLVQLLKRHRDVRYNGDDDKPISIIITTLAAQAYNNEASINEAILNVVPRMRSHIEKQGNSLWVPNPVNPQENFADKWAEQPRKAKLFYEWLRILEQEYQDLLTDRGFEKIGDYLSEAFGQRDSKVAMEKFGALSRKPSTSAKLSSGVVIPRKSDQPTKPQIELPRKPSKPWGHDLP